MRLASIRIALAAPFMAACASSASTQQPCIDPAATTAGQTTVATAAASGPADADSIAGSAPKACSDAKLAADGLIDDFEDGDTQLAKVGGRDGYWWTSADSNGSTIAPKEVVGVAGGADSPRAVNFKGTTSGASGAWGVNFGVNFLSAKMPYDGSPYAGVSFKAKVGPNSSKKIRFKIGDINTHQDAGVCTACWNHFGKDVELTEQWQEVRVLFTDLAQGSGWGQPRPPHLATDKLWNIDFSIPPGSTYDVWVDDVRLLQCP
ncbi:MAG TPA: carbohydrate binding domain-containing protein [Polyangiaceae bacterium]